MAVSPPFDINQSIPGDNDIVSQHPFNARVFRDTVESWIRVNHDTNGNHFRIDMPRGANPGTPAASIDMLYVTATGRLKIVHSDGTEEYVGIPPGSIIYGSGALPTGYLNADASAVSRSVFADLFGIIGANYGSGDGSTTFNLPDIIGRVIAGLDGANLRIGSAYIASAGSPGGNGGLDHFLIPQTALPNVNLTVGGSASVTTSVNVLSTNTLFAAGYFNNAGGGAVNYADGGAAVGHIASTGSISGTASLNGGVTQTNTSLMQPTVVMRAMIKY